MRVFALIFIGLCAASLYAWTMKPDPAPGGKTRLIWVSDDNPLRRAQIEPFNALHPEYDVQLDPTNSEMEKVIVQSLAGVGPDFFDCYSAFQLSAYVRAGIAWDITDELMKLGIDVKSETWKAVHPDCVYNGRVYGHPVNAAANGIWFHKDILREAGVTLPSGPWTWEQFLPIAQKLTVHDGNRTRYGLLLDWENNYLQFILQWGGAMYSPDGTRCTIDSPQCIEALQFMQDLIYRYKISPSPVDESSMSTAGGWGGGTGSSITFFGAKKGAMAMGGRWWLCRLRDADYRDLQLGAVESPYGKHHVFLGYGKATLINKSSPRREDALKFMQYLNSNSYNALINHQADGIGPVIEYVEGDAFLHDAEYPNEDFNGVWRDMMKAAVPEQTSPFINGGVVHRLIKKQLDQIRSNEKTVPAALRDAARQINEQIEENLEINPELRRQFDEVTRKHATANAQ